MGSKRENRADVEDFRLLTWLVCQLERVKKASYPEDIHIQTVRRFLMLGGHRGIELLFVPKLKAMAVFVNQNLKMYPCIIPA